MAARYAIGDPWHQPYEEQVFYATPEAWSTLVLSPGAMYAASMSAESFAEEFFRRHPHLHAFAPKRVVDKQGGGGSHPEARQAGNEIHLYPKFWSLDAATRDFVFTHELGHYALSKFGLSRLIEILNKLGVDPWDTSKPFWAAQHG